MPVGQIVVCPHVAPAHECRPPAEVRRLVPAVAGARQRLDDALEIRLHRVGLPRELRAVGVREAGPRLGLELVAGQVLRPERERLVEVARQIGGALAGNAVQEVERNVVKRGITKMVERAPDGLGTGAPLERDEEMGPEALRSERDAVDAGPPQKRRERRRKEESLHRRTTRRRNPFSRDPQGSAAVPRFPAGRG